MGEGRTAALAAVGIEGELGHQQDIGPAVPGGAVEFVAAVSFTGKDAQIQQLARHAPENRAEMEVRAVLLAKAGQDQQALADGAGGLSVHSDGRFKDTLDQESHRSSPGVAAASCRTAWRAVFWACLAISSSRRAWRRTRRGTL